MSDTTYMTGLQQYDILDTEPEPQFDRIVQMTARLFDAPISAISFLDIDRQWFKARYGFAFDDVPCAGTLCRHTIRADRGTVVLDAAADERFRGDPLVVGAPGIRFYAGAGIHAGDGQLIGTLFVADDRPRAALQAHALEELQMLARLVEAEIEGRDLRRTLTDAMDRFRELADVSSDWVWETDDEHRLVGLFSGHPCMSGIASGGMGKRRWEYRDSRPLEGTWQDHIAVMEAHKDFRDLKYEVTTGDGQPRTFRVSGRPIHDSRGRFVGYRGTGSEITEQQRAEARMAEIEANLRQSQKLEALGMLTSGIVHDFNNILSIIILKLEAMSDELPADSRQQKRIADALDATDRGTTLISRILGFARRRDPAPGEIRIGEVLDTLSDLLTTAVPRGIALSVHVADDLPTCTIDRSRFETAMLNVVVNARDATPCGGEIEVSVRSRAIANHDGLQPGDWIEVSVRDTGAGIPPDVQARIFEPFFTTKQETQGTGLGLSMVHEFVQQSGGFLTLSSTPGKGTTLSMYFPTAAEGLVPAAELQIGAQPFSAMDEAGSSNLLDRTRRRTERWREAAIAFGRRIGDGGAARRLRRRGSAQPASSPTAWT